MRKIDLQRLTGNRDHLKEKLRNLYGEGDYEEKVSSHEKRIRKRYLFIGVLFLFTVLYTTLGGDERLAKTEIRDGRMVSVERPLEGEEPVALDARIWAVSEDAQVSQEKQIFVAPRNALRSEHDVLKEEPESVRLERRISTVSRSLNQDTASARIILPTELEDGTEIRWELLEKSSSPTLLFVFLAIFFFIYRSRYDGIIKEEKVACASVIAELPEFINKLVLLLNGGLVLQSAMEKVISDRKKMRGEKENYFYNQMDIIYSKTKETNASMHEEFYRFARRSKVQKLMRIAGILSDNVSKGSDLAVKLQREGEMLWFARKKQSEERGRLAETKMTLPLVILLLVLVMITIAPALMEM